MATYIGIVLSIWICSLAIWWAVSRSVRSSDVDRMKNRLLGTKRSSGKKKGDGEGAALFQTEETDKGQVINKILKKYKLTTKLQDLLEQAGVKWHPARFVHTC